MTDEFNSIIAQAKRVVQTHRNIAADAFPRGVTLKCSRCGTTQQATETQCARYLATGWPAHCGRTMTAERQP